MITQIDLDKLEQKMIDLILIRVDSLVDKIEKMDGDIDRKFQSLECGFVALQKTLNETVLTFLQGQEERHKELLRLTNIANDHEKRIENLENENFRDVKLI